MASRRWPTKLVMSWEAVGDVQLCTCRTQFELLNKLSCCCTVVAIWNQFWSLTISSAASVICTFQDSVPAGSYNDPFLSSVCEPSEDVKLLILLFSILRGRGVRHDCGTALNEATTIMGYWV